MCNTDEMDDSDGIPTQECFNKHPLTRAPGDGDASPIDPAYPGRYYGEDSLRTGPRAFIRNPSLSVVAAKRCAIVREMCAMFIFFSALNTPYNIHEETPPRPLPHAHPHAHVAPRSPVSMLCS